VIGSFLDAHLNLQWLRPESALCDAIVSTLIAELPFHAPSLDLGCGNGLFSFVTAGGTFTEDYDWYRNARPGDGDMYDVVVTVPRAEWVARRPRYTIDVGFDAKENLLAQAAALGFYGRVECGDANLRLPFADESFATVFSNILSWLDSAAVALAEIHRTLRSGGHAILCLPTERVVDYCPSYRWRQDGSRLLELLNRGRAATMRWSPSAAELEALSARTGFRIIDRREYWSPLTMRVWDIGLRPLSPVLIRLMSTLGDKERAAVKREWLETLRPFADELVAMDASSTAPGAYQLVHLERR
jgi:SAM-dependent methyltransferase